MKPDITSRFARYRIRDPSRFDQLRTKDIGRKNHTKVIIGRLKGSKEWKLQSVLVDINDYEAGTRIKIKNGKVRFVKR